MMFLEILSSMYMTDFPDMVAYLHSMPTLLRYVNIVQNLSHRISLFIVYMCFSLSTGGNMLLNVGPSHDGRIMPIFEEILLQIGLNHHITV